ncbi:unnamed protein product [Trichobilharzia szidati]|nr:unnamed protein product [Trichobilharzia szidati]
MSKTQTNFVDAKSFCLNGHNEDVAEDLIFSRYDNYDSNEKVDKELIHILPSLLMSPSLHSSTPIKSNAIDDQFKWQYVKRAAPINRAYPNYIFNNPLETPSSYYEPLPRSSGENYDQWMDAYGKNEAMNTEMYNENQMNDFSQRIQQMIPLSENLRGESNYENKQVDGHQLMDDTSQRKDNEMITEPKLYQYYNLIPASINEESVDENSALEFQPQQRQEEMISPFNSITRLRAQKLMSGPYKHLEHRWIWIKFLDGPISNEKAESILSKMSHDLKLTSPISFFFLDKSRRVLYFHIPSNAGITADRIVNALITKIHSIDGYTIEDVGFGRGATVDKSARFDAVAAAPVYDGTSDYSIREKWEKYTMTIILCSSILGVVVILTLIYLVQVCQRRRRNKIKSESNENLSSPHSEESIHSSKKSFGQSNKLSESQHSSVSSWSNEPIQCSIDVPTGHLILSYMEEHLRDRDRLIADWNSIDKYVSEESVLFKEGENPKNKLRNRLGAPLPYEQSRVKLRSGDNDYINASLLYDNNPRNPVYIATMTPTIESIPDFWLMVWEQGCVVIVCLERNDELKRMDEVNQLEPNDASVKYWPNEGTQVYGSFEVHLVSEHSWSENYIIRSFYLKSMTTNETRTVTQFHYLTWKDESLKDNSKPILEFRRKVNRSFRGMMSPILVHCSDGCGRTGAYILLDLALNRIVKGIKEIDIGASLEHLRDQRPNMIRTLEQYEFVLSSTAEEVDAMLQTNT